MATVQVFFCHTCFADHKLGDTITLADGRSYKKAGLEKKKNEEEVDEYWVQCDHCESWVHQICGMFNKGRNSNDTHYLCPGCLLAGLESRRRERITVSGVPSPLLHGSNRCLDSTTSHRNPPVRPLSNLSWRRPPLHPRIRILDLTSRTLLSSLLQVRPQAMLTAMDLPKTALSEFLEAHMGAAIEMERMARAERLGYPPNQIPGAGGLSVRVVNNIMKKSEVKQRFGDIFCTPEVKFPSEFPYRQRVICLFQVRRQRFGR